MDFLTLTTTCCQIELPEALRRAAFPPVTASCGRNRRHRQLFRAGLHRHPVQSERSAWRPVGVSTSITAWPWAWARRTAAYFAESGAEAVDLLTDIRRDRLCPECLRPMWKARPVHGCQPRDGQLRSSAPPWWPGSLRAAWMPLRPKARGGLRREAPPGHRPPTYPGNGGAGPQLEYHAFPRRRADPLQLHQLRDRTPLPEGRMVIRNVLLATEAGPRQRRDAYLPHPDLPREGGHKLQPRRTRTTTCSSSPCKLRQAPVPELLLPGCAVQPPSTTRAMPETESRTWAAAPASWATCTTPIAR